MLVSYNKIMEVFIFILQVYFRVCCLKKKLSFVFSMLSTRIVTCMGHILAICDKWFLNMVCNLCYLCVMFNKILKGNFVQIKQKFLKNTFTHLFDKGTLSSLSRIYSISLLFDCWILFCVSHVWVLNPYYTVIACVHSNHGVF